MTRITVDETLRGKLGNLAEPLELCDQFGRVVAQVFPVADLSQYDLRQPDVSAEELREQERVNQRWYTTSEVLQHLEGR
jgi:hypothetical protein